MTYTPPPYGEAPRKKGTNPLVWIFVALGAFCCIAIIAFVGMGAAVFNQGKDMFPCIFTISTLNKSMKEYVQDKGKFPDADKWQSELAPYYNKSSKSFKDEMKDAPGPLKGMGDVADISMPVACNTSGTKTFISYNSEIAGKEMKDITDKDDTAMFYEDLVEKINASAPFKPKDFKDSPRMMGQPRGWYVVVVSGDMQTVDEKGKKHNVDISTGN